MNEDALANWGLSRQNKNASMAAMVSTKQQWR
jgi:hypothetical protein